MNVVHIITSLRQGGAEATLEKLILASGSTSPHVKHSVISLREFGVVGPRLAAAGIEVHALGMGGAMPTIKALFRLAGILRRLPRHTVVQTWLYHADLIGGMTARLVGVRRVVWNLRGAVERRDFGFGAFMIVRLCALLSRWTPCRIVNCGPTVMESHVALGYQRSKCLVIGNGFDTQRLRHDPQARLRIRRELGFATDVIVVGMVARMHPQKDFRTMALAAQEVCRSHPAATFLWVGEGVDSNAELDACLDSLQIRHRVKRLGLRSDIPQLLSAMDVFCLSSRSEGFPNVIGEAMACGLPCVATDAGESSFLLGDPRWIVPVESPSQLAGRLAAMLDLPADERSRLGHCNRARVTEEFAIQRSWNHYLELYERLPQDC